MEEINKIGELEILSISGFDGQTLNGLHVHPDKLHIIYPFGNSVTIQNLKTRKQQFLSGHNNLVSAVALSPTGKYVASGQINHIGFKALVIIWDFETRTKIGSYEIHQVRVEYLTFSAGDKYLISLGGRDDARILVYDIEQMHPVCSDVANGANAGIAMTIASSKKKGSFFLTGGDRTLRLWQIDATQRKSSFIEVNFNKVKRIVTCITVDENDEYFYCGTTSGDIVKVAMKLPEEGETISPPMLVGVFGKQAERKKSPTQAEWVRTIVVLKPGQLIIGAGDGTVEVVEEVEKIIKQQPPGKKVKEPTIPKLKRVRKHDVQSGVSSIKILENRILVATEESEIYSIGIEKWDLKLINTCHKSTIYDVCFPSDTSMVFATGSLGSVRIWNTLTGQELLRIQVPNITCSGVLIQHNGRGIITSWNDGKIRAFTPQTGQLKYIIHDAHNKGVSALAITRDDQALVSGGGEGQVRVWDITEKSQKLRAVLKEHKGPVSAIHVNHANDEAASASTDGSCIIWDILKCTRKNIIFAKTLFMAVCFHTSDCQILTTGTDRKIAYWETFDGSLIRDIEGSTANINTVDVSPCGEFFVTAGNDQIVKLWRYVEGEITHTGIGHPGIITQARFSPDSRFIISVSSDGAIFRWKNPYFTQTKPKTDQEAPEIETVRSKPGDKVSTKTNRESVKDLKT